jgi:hypothetical protein
MTARAALAPADPNKPNEAIPQAMTQPQYGEPINIATAKKVAAGAIAKAKKRNWNGRCVAIVGPSGDLAYFDRITASLGPYPFPSTRRALPHAIDVRPWYASV